MNEQPLLLPVFKQFSKERLSRLFEIDSNAYLTMYSAVVYQWPMVCYMEDSCLMFSSLLPIKVPRSKVSTISRYLNSAYNTLDVRGAFVFDEEDRQLYYNTFLDVADGAATVRMLFALFDSHRVAEPILIALADTFIDNQGFGQNVSKPDQDEEERRERNALNELLRDVDLDSIGDNDED